MKPQKIREGDLVRIIQGGGRHLNRATPTLSEQRYKVVDLIGRPAVFCMMTQWPSTAPKGKVMAKQFFALSLLVVDNTPANQAEMNIIARSQRP